MFQVKMNYFGSHGFALKRHLLDVAEGTGDVHVPAGAAALRESGARRYYFVAVEQLIDEMFDCDALLLFVARLKTERES